MTLMELKLKSLKHKVTEIKIYNYYGINLSRNKTKFFLSRNTTQLYQKNFEGYACIIFEINRPGYQSSHIRNGRPGLAIGSTWRIPCGLDIKEAGRR